MFNSIKIRKGQPDPKLSHEEFITEYKKSFYDPRFRSLDVEIERLAEIAWENYKDSRKAPITMKAGPGAVASYIGYYGTYAESHDELDKNKDFMKEVEISAASLVKQIELNRSGKYLPPDAGFEHPMQK